MQSDRYLKAVLTVIAVCLTWICVRDVALVKPAHAGVDSNVSAIESYVGAIWNGGCPNSKIC